MNHLMSFCHDEDVCTIRALVFLGISVQPMALAMISSANTVVKDGAGASWNSSAIYEATTLVGLHTLVFCILIAIFIVLQRKKNNTQP
jgi:hypothetical protein